MKIIIGLIVLLVIILILAFVLGAIKDSIFIHFGGNPYDE